MNYKTRHSKYSFELCARGVTRLDGARCKKPVWRPRVWTWDLSEASLLYWRKYLWYCCDFSAILAVIRLPHSDWAPGELWPPWPPAYAPA